MRKFFALSLTVVLASIVGIQWSRANQEQKKPKYAIADVMQEAHLAGLLGKVTTGQASREEKEKLLSMYISLWENKPPKGDPKAWAEKTTPMVVNAAKTLLNEEGAPAALKAIVNCAACHKDHK